MNRLLKDVLSKYIADWENCVVEYGVFEINDPLKTPKEFVYYFEVYNGAFKNETKQFQFKYFRKLDRSEVIKFVFRSLSDVKSIYDFIDNKFRKRFICY